MGNMAQPLLNFNFSSYVVCDVLSAGIDWYSLWISKQPKRDCRTSNTPFWMESTCSTGQYSSKLDLPCKLKMDFSLTVYHREIISADGDAPSVRDLSQCWEKDKDNEILLTQWDKSVTYYLDSKIVFIKYRANKITGTRVPHNTICLNDRDTCSQSNSQPKIHHYGINSYYWW